MKNDHKNKQIPCAVTFIVLGLTATVHASFQPLLNGIAKSIKELPVGTIREAIPKSSDIKARES